MKRAVIVGRVISIESVLDHLIDEPAVDSFVKMWRFYSEKKDTQGRGQAENAPEHPVAFQRIEDDLSGVRRTRGKIRSRRFATAASTRSDAHFGNGRLRFHWQQLYSLHSETLQASLRHECRCPDLRRQPRQSRGRDRGTWRSLRILQGRYRSCRPDG